jgi:hypothetical protein
MKNVTEIVKNYTAGRQAAGRDLVLLFQRARCQCIADVKLL